MSHKPTSPDAQRRQLLELLRARGIQDERVLEAINSVPRELFVPAGFREQAYADQALPIGSRQTISQPFIVARMTELLKLKGNEKVLEVGTGSGYQTAILANLAERVVSIERIPALQEKARSALDQLQFPSIELQIGDGSLGWPKEAPYDAILVTAAAPQVPEPLYEQLKPGGRLVIPVGTEANQILQVVEKSPNGRRVTTNCYCRFVPLIGEAGWADLPDFDDS